MAGAKVTLQGEKMQFEFTAEYKKKLIIFLVVGLVMFIVGVALLGAGIGDPAHGAEHGHEAHEGGHSHYNWMTRVWANLWLCAVYFNGIALVGVFFVAVNYLAYAGWSALIKRVPEAFGYFLMITGPIILILFFVAGHDLFHWTHTDLYDKSNKEAFDEILYAKSGFFFFPLSPEGGFPAFFLIRMFLYFALWIGLFLFIRRLSLKEDTLTDYSSYLKNPTIYNKKVYWSAVFIVVFAASTSVAAWDWVMSIDTHWFSTMFGWYNFASWFAAGLAAITLAVLTLKDMGYFKTLNEHHIHDLGKFMFAFSIFWTYIWFSQFLLIYYAHIPEETVYFNARLNAWGGKYKFLFFANLVINFAFPFLILMTKEAKRTTRILKVVAFALLIGHYLDFYMMIMPGTVKEHGGFGLVEFGSVLIFASAFVYVISHFLSKAPLIAKNHPFINESLNFSQFN